jgi:DNA polymerase III epsilon subunit-like protein
VYLFFDTETTGLPRSYDAPASNVSNWPRLVQLAWVLADRRGAVLKSPASLVRPDGFVIPRDAARVHGITTEIARRSGIEIGQVLTEFEEDLAGAEVVVAHNIEYDARVVGAEFFRAGRKQSPISAKTLACTMRLSTDFCAIAGGPRGYKWPTLQQLHQRLFNAGFTAAHNAATDVSVCAKCFFELKRRGVIKVGPALDEP